MFKWFMAKSLITKIIIVTSSVVVIGGTTAGVIIVPKVIEQQQQKQLEREQQEQLQKEKEEDLANMTLVIKEDYREGGINLPLNLVTQGIQTVRYPDIEHAFSPTDDTKDKEELKTALIKELIESYEGGELTVEENIDIHKKGDYPVKFILTSEKGNTKTETVKVTVFNYFRVSVDVKLGTETITVTKGTDVDIMKDISFSSNLPKEEQGHIETEGTVDINKVGTYKITYKYIPKDENEGIISEGTRTYKVIEKPNVKLNTDYILKDYGWTAHLKFISNSEFTYTTIYDEGGNGGTQRGTYTVKGNKVTLKCSDWGEKYFVINNNNNTFSLDPQFYNENSWD